MSDQLLEGRRLVVIGASAGIGRSAALGAVRAGAEVVLGARRQALLDEAVEAAGGGTALTVDLGDPESCARFARGAADELGEIDGVLFTAGTAPLCPIEDTTPQQWAATMATNAVALNVIASTLLPSLRPTAVVAALSSEAVEMPRYGLSAYGASKAALEQALRSWRLEHPEVRFSTITVGSTIPTEFGAGFEPGFLGRALNVWAVQGLAQTEFMDTDDLAAMLIELLATMLAHPSIGMENVVLRSPSGITADTDALFQAASLT